MNQRRAFLPAGTVYGTLLNFRGERDFLAAQMDQPPYKAPPQAPVLYVKTANTWSANGADVMLPAGVPQVEVGASVALVVGPAQFSASGGSAVPTIAGYVLVNDLSVPHASFFRPPVRFKNLDGFLGIGAQALPAAEAGDPAQWVLEVRINGELRQTLRFADLVRNAATLLADVSDFMRLRAGDWLLLGCDVGRPLARAADHIAIGMPDRPAFGVLTNTLRAADDAQEAA